MDEDKSQLEIINSEIKKELAKKEVVGALLQTTFKGLSEVNMRKAMFEGMMRGFQFKDFLEKNVYAIPFKDNYSLITSIDYARKIGIRSGVCGKSKPEFEEDNDKIISCTITIKKKTGNYIGDFSETAFFSEYYKKPFVKNGYEVKSLWDTKPRTMIAKVAEMHALRMACPEELSQVYVEEEFQREVSENELPAIELNKYQTKLEAAKSIKEVQKVWASLPQKAKAELEGLKNQLKKTYENTEIQK
jgi:tRNA-binding EMAP/Myf-like protein